MNTVAQIIATKNDQVTYTMEPSTTVHEAVCLMVEKNIGSLVVVKNGKVVGIVSERDYARKLVLTVAILWINVVENVATNIFGHPVILHEVNEALVDLCCIVRLCMVVSFSSILENVMR